MGQIIRHGNTLGLIPVAYNHQLRQTLALAVDRIKDKHALAHLN